MKVAKLSARACLPLPDSHWASKASVSASSAASAASAWLQSGRRRRRPGRPACRPGRPPRFGCCDQEIRHVGSAAQPHWVENWVETPLPGIWAAWCTVEQFCGPCGVRTSARWAWMTSARPWWTSAGVCRPRPLCRCSVLHQGRSPGARRRIRQLSAPTWLLQRTAVTLCPGITGRMTHPALTSGPIESRRRTSKVTDNTQRSYGTDRAMSM